MRDRQRRTCELRLSVVDRRGRAEGAGMPGAVSRARAETCPELGAPAGMAGGRAFLARVSRPQRRRKTGLAPAGRESGTKLRLARVSSGSGCLRFYSHLPCYDET